MERSDADFYHIFMPHDTDGKNRYKAENNGKFHLFSSGWKNGENHLFPSRWKFGPYQQKNGGGIVVIPPPRFTLPASFSVGLSAWRWACALPRCGSRDFRISRRIPKTRTRPQSETDSDFVGLVRLTGVEPVRPFGHKHLKLASLPIPAQPHCAV